VRKGKGLELQKAGQYFDKIDQSKTIKVVGDPTLISDMAKLKYISGGQPLTLQAGFVGPNPEF